MRKNYLRQALIVLAILSCTIFVSDGLTYLIVSLMAFAIVAIIGRNRSWVMKMTRWGKANPHKAQVFITVLQIALMVFGITSGYNLKKLGYELSDLTAVVFSSIMVLCFFSVRFLPKRSTIAIPAEVKKNRLFFIGIALSSYVLMVLTGNRIGDNYPDATITRTLEAFDQAIFPNDHPSYTYTNDMAAQEDNLINYRKALAVNASSLAVNASFASFNNETVEPSPDLKKETREKLKAEKKIKKLEKKIKKLTRLLSKKRLGFMAAITAGAVILLILLIIPLCGGICLMIAGFGGSGAGYVFLGALLAGGSIFGMVKLSQGGKKPKNNN